MGLLLRTRGIAVLAEQKLAALKKRFCDLSLFVKEVTERFSRWFNKRGGRRGTLWMDRFKRVLVEGNGESLCMIGGIRPALLHAAEIAVAALELIADNEYASWNTWPFRWR